jgi:diguanylate cyclase (GGDEF)-like protein
MSEKGKILVVDDDPNLRKTVADILKVKGYETLVAGTGAEALAAAQREFFNLALIDLMLPDMFGLEVMEKLKAIAPLSEAVILTGHASMDTAIEATKKGAFSYLLKPYQMDDLLLTIRHGVERQQAQEEILRLASHPRLNPNPVIELTPEGVVTYVNPAADKLFPDLHERGMAHPLLACVGGRLAALRQSKEILCEQTFNEATYEEHISYIEEVNLVRVYVLDVTERKRALEALAARERESAAIAELGTETLAGLELPSVFEKAVLLAAKTLNVSHGLMWELPLGESALMMRAATGFDEDMSKTQLSTDAATLAGFALQSKEPVYVADLHEEKRFTMPPFVNQPAFLSSVLLRVGPVENILGLLAVFSAQQREFSQDDINFLQAIANVVASAVQRKRDDDAIRVLATTDSLTGIANRREFSNSLDREIERAKRYGGILSLVMYDIDHFKRVNDTFGHDAGDQILKVLTEVVSDSIRTADFIARWGGEEFVVLTPQTDLEGAVALAEKLRLKVVDHSFEKVGNITISLGVAEFHDGDDANTLFNKVDNALYKAKENGRNRVEALRA